MVIRKRCLAWDYTNTRDIPTKLDKISFTGPLHSVHNWNAWYPTELKSRAPFRPMIRTLAQLSGSEWQMILTTKEHFIHYFNEPERASISASLAASHWHSLLVPQLRQQRGKALVSPSPSNDAAGQAWLADFMNRVSSAPPDYLGLHYYGEDPSAARKFLEDMHKKYPKQKVIVTEIACISRDKGKVYDFTRNIANWMDECEWIAEYAFFGCMRQVADGFVSPAAQLMDGSGELTELGRKLMTEQPIKK